MASPTPTITRVAYIRTIIDNDKEREYYEGCWASLRIFLWSWVGQKVHNDPAGTGAPRLRSSPPPGLRQHYIIGYSNPVDAFVLEWLLENSKPDSWRMSRNDFEVFLSEVQMKDPTNKEFLQKLELEQVKVTTYSTATPFAMAILNATTLKNSHSGTTIIDSRTRWAILGDHVHIPTANPTPGNSNTQKIGKTISANLVGRDASVAKAVKLRVKIGRREKM
ncbi:peptidase A1 [Fusarium mexicanum]|uniref:Peptidase A1 n=1 Tax=Fusarium mexicanum TaxID=751941 RepID=A0A8H5J9N1_9HYPO|nr:peptidase A1 [Fusarium mexicanum]